MDSDGQLSLDARREEIYFEVMVRAYRLCRRAQRIRVATIGFVAVALLARCLMPFTGLSDTFVSGKPMLGIIYMATFFTFCLEWSTRVQYREILRDCEDSRRMDHAQASR